MSEHPSLEILKDKKPAISPPLDLSQIEKKAAILQEKTEALQEKAQQITETLQNIEQKEDETDFLLREALKLLIKRLGGTLPERTS